MFVYQKFFLLGGNFDRIFKQLSNRIMSLSYDFDSITHYGQYAYSITGLPTIITKDPTKTDVIGQRTHLSEIDLMKVKVYYNCGKCMFW